MAVATTVTVPTTDADVPGGTTTVSAKGCCRMLPAKVIDAGLTVVAQPSEVLAWRLTVARTLAGLSIVTFPWKVTAPGSVAVIWTVSCAG
jgi:hypothetical protein